MTRPIHHVAFFLIFIAAVCSPVIYAQSCASGTMASNPPNVYVIDTINGTVTDTRTGLMWDRCPRGQSGVACGTGSAAALTWAAAISVPATLGIYKGYSDWRLPNVKELRSLVEECRVFPSINEEAFPATPALDFWSSSPFAGIATNAWEVDFGSGVSSGDNRLANNLVRLVRGGQQ